MATLERRYDLVPIDLPECEINNYNHTRIRADRVWRIFPIVAITCTRNQPENPTRLATSITLMSPSPSIPELFSHPHAISTRLADDDDGQQLSNTFPHVHMPKIAALTWPMGSAGWQQHEALSLARAVR